MKNICRICLKNDGIMENIFQYNINSSDTLAGHLYWIFSVEVDVTDGYSKLICQGCIIYIQEILSFTEQVKRNQLYLTKYVDTEGEEDSFQEQRKNNGSTELDDNVIKVPLDVMQTFSPQVTVQITKFEQSDVYKNYKRINKTTFRKKKRCKQIFKVDPKIMENICQSLKFTSIGNKDASTCTETLTTEIGINTEEIEINTEECNGIANGVCENSNIGINTEEIEINTEECSGIANGVCENSTNKFKSNCNNKFQKDYFFIDYSQNNKCENSSSFGDFSFDVELLENIHQTIEDIGIEQTTEDWTTMLFSKTTETSKEILKSDKATMTTMQLKKNDYLTVPVTFLNNHSPTVVLNPLKNIIAKENYKQIGESTYRKIDEHMLFNNYNRKLQNINYYYSLNTYAVRELITGKDFRDHSKYETPLVNISNVRNVFVCEYCSKVFNSQSYMDIHRNKMHTPKDNSDISNKNPKLNRNIKRKRKRKNKYINVKNLIFSVQKKLSGCKDHTVSKDKRVKKHNNNKQESSDDKTHNKQNSVGYVDYVLYNELVDISLKNVSGVKKVNGVLNQTIDRLSDRLQT